LYCIGGRSALLVLWSSNAAGSKNLVLDFRFAGQPGHVTHARYRNRMIQQTTDPEDIRAFLDGAAKSNNLYVRVSSDLYGTSDANFSLRGGKEMVARFEKVCSDSGASR
jgi:hypothetical protein